MDGRGPISVTHSIIIFFLILTGLAFALANIVPLEGGGTDVGSSLQTLSTVLVEVLLAVGLLLVAWVAVWYFLNHRRGSVSLERNPKSNFLSTFIIIVLIIVVMLVIPQLVTNNPLFQNDDPITDGGDNGTSGEDPIRTGGAYGIFLPTLMIFSVGLVLILLFLFIKKRDRPLIEPQEWKRPRRQELAAISTSLEQIETQKDVREAILYTYRRMLRLLSLDDSINRMTAHELANRLVNVLGWPSSPTASLTFLFEEAKYSQHPLGEAHRTEALDSLGHIQEWLDRRTEVYDAEKV